MALACSVILGWRDYGVWNVKHLLFEQRLTICIMDVFGLFFVAHETQ